MANELVPLGKFHLPEAPTVPIVDENGEPWDLPPELDPAVAHTVRPHFAGEDRSHRQQRINNAPEAKHDARVAEARGDTGFAFQRDTDAAERQQSRYDWGDARTWAIIAAMFFGFLLLVTFVYYMPHGRHNQADGGNQGGAPTPSIRVY